MEKRYSAIHLVNASRQATDLCAYNLLISGAKI